MTVRAAGARPVGRRPRRSSPAGARDADLRLARLHLRTGLLALARAELETMAGLGTLDRPALADLAEVRWRGGDLVGAGEAAHAHLDAGGEELMALIVAAEALEARGHTAEARDHAQRVVDRAGGDLDDLFAGAPRSGIWPEPEEPPASRMARRPGRHGLLAGGAELALGQAASRGEVVDAAWRVLDPPAREAFEPPARRGARTRASDAGPPDARRTAEPAFPYAIGDTRPETTSDPVEVGLAAGRELEVIEDLLARSELTTVPERLSLLLRADRALAPVVLSMADRGMTSPGASPATRGALHLVRGDAYRILGRAAEASAAYERSLEALRAVPTRAAPSDEEPP